MNPLTVTALTTATPEEARACFVAPASIQRWNIATAGWSCPEASTDLRPGGAFSYTMAADDGSMSFDYAGVWEVVEPLRLVQRLGDGRCVETVFAAVDGGTRVTQQFDPDPTAPRSMQQAGWQAILHRFADIASGAPVITLEELAPRHFVGIRRQLPTSELGAFFAEVLPAVMQWLDAHAIVPASPPMAMWCAMDMQTGIADCHAGAFVYEPVAGEGEVTGASTPGGDVLVLTHTGPYDTVGRSWMAAYRRATELGRTPGAGWEIYLDDPGSTPASELRTQIHLPLT